MYRLFRYGECVASGGLLDIIKSVGPIPDDKAKEYTVELNGRYRWLHTGEDVDVASLIALCISEDDGPHLGRGDGADAIARMVGLHYELACHHYGYMSREEYDEMIAAGEVYAAELDAQEEVRLS
jgi:hypothetical protein